MVGINPGLCDECGTCIGVCPVDAIAMESQPQFNAERCIDCGRCITACPFGALQTMQREGHR